MNAPSTRSVTAELELALFHEHKPTRLFMAMTAYVDESGTHGGSRLTVMAAWLGYSERWRQFEGVWSALCARDGITHIHAKELKQGTGQFRGWPRPRRAALMREATQLAQDHGLVCLSLILKNSDYDVVYVGADRAMRRRRAPVDSKYGVCFRALISMVADFVATYEPPDNRLIQIIVEAGHKNSGAAQQIFSEFEQYAPDAAALISGVDYARKKDSPGVQAADLVAYPVYSLEHDEIAKFGPIDWSSADPTKRPPMHLRGLITQEMLTNFKRGLEGFAALRRQKRR